MESGRTKMTLLFQLKYLHAIPYFYKKQSLYWYFRWTCKLSQIYGTTLKVNWQGSVIENLSHVLLQISGYSSYKRVVHKHYQSISKSQIKDKFIKNLTEWKGCTLSSAGKIFLIKSNMTAIPHLLTMELIAEFYV